MAIGPGLTAVRGFAAVAGLGFAIALGFAAARAGRDDAGLRAAVVVRDRDAVADALATVRDLTAVRGRRAPWVSRLAGSWRLSSTS